MTRYVMAGAAVMAGFVLLFIASFGSLHRQAAGAIDQPRDGSVSSEQLAAMRAQIQDATQTVTTLQSQVQQARQDLATLQSQRPGQPQPRRPVAPPPPVPAPTRPAASTASPRRPDDATIQQTEAAPRPAESDARSAMQDALDRLRRTVAATQTTDNAAYPHPQAVVPPSETPPAPSSPPAGESARVPAIDRLTDARAAVVAGRTDDASRFLQAAQLLLVFRAEDPGGPVPRASQAAAPVGRALAALGDGDRDRALAAIDQAIGVLGTPPPVPRQFGSLPPVLERDAALRGMGGSATGGSP
jgi:hypothetical protein